MDSCLSVDIWGKIEAGVSYLVILVIKLFSYGSFAHSCASVSNIVALQYGIIFSKRSTSDHYLAILGFLAILMC